MNRPAATPDDDTGPPSLPPRVIARVFFRISRGFWTGPTKRLAWGLTLGLLALVLLSLGVQIGINRWNKEFFDALQQKNVPGVLWGVVYIVGLAIAAAAVAVTLVHTRMRLQLRWRQWLTKHLTAWWLSERRFYQLTIMGQEGNHPEFRIADDVRLAIEPLVDFLIGVSNAILAAAAFIGILWAVGGGLSVGGFQIPGYMVWAAIVYSALTSFAMVIVGRPLIRAVERKNASEAKFRYELTRVRERAETIALIGGDEDERARLDETFLDVASRWLVVIVRQARMTWISNANSVLAPVVPLLLGAPKFLNGQLSLGELMQIATAFTQVQIALNWLIDNAIRLAETLASAQRVVQLSDALDDLDETIGKHGSSDTIVLGDSPDDAIHIEGLSITQQNGKIMIDGASATIGPGEKVLVKGESGTGKSTLIRAMAGLWPWGSGRILRPPAASFAFLPQQPYIPLGSLRHSMLYPDTDRDVPDEVLQDALRKCGLSYLGERLDEDEQWDGVLSGGEKQRLAFARLLIDPPDIVIMDEATSALDEVSQARMMGFLRHELSRATVLSVGHRPGLEEYHDREIRLMRDDEGAGATARHRRYPRFRQLWNRLTRPGPQEHERPAPRPGAPSGAETGGPVRSGRDSVNDS